MQFCQGDVMMETCDPSATKGLKKTKPTVALGEATGHNHSFEGKHAVGFYKEGDDNAGGGSALAEFVKITGAPSALKHQEHGPITCTPQTMAYTPQLEWDAVGMARPVTD